MNKPYVLYEKLSEVVYEKMGRFASVFEALQEVIELTKTNPQPITVVCIKENSPNEGRQYNEFTLSIASQTNFSLENRR